MADGGAVPNGSLLGLLTVCGQTIAIDVEYLGEVAPIKHLESTLMTQPGVLGLLSIRGGLIPVCDPFGLYDGKTLPATAAILSDKTNVVSLAVDGVHGLHRYQPEDLQRIDGVSEQAYSKGALLIDDQLVHVIDGNAILSDGRLPRSHLKAHKVRSRGKKAKGNPFLSFSVGGVMFAIRVQAIWGTVPRQPIEDSTLATGSYLGDITLQQRRVPVMATNAVFGLGGTLQSDRSETVVLQFPDNQVLGFAVDKICHVAHPKTDQIIPLAAHIHSAISLIEATATINGVKHFLIGEEGLHADPHLRAAAELSIKEDSPETGPDFAADIEGELIPERERYLLLCAGKKLAIRMTDVIGIRAPPTPDEISPCSGAGPGAMGLFFIDNSVLPLIRLSTYLGNPADPDPDPAKARVVVSQDGAAKVGFLIDTVDGIATSIWSTKSDAQTPAQPTLVGLTHQGQSEVRNCVDLRGLARQITST